MAATRKFNRRRAIYLLASICLVGTVLGGLWGFRAYRITRRFAAIKLAGLEAAKAADHVQAVAKLGDYLARYPNDPDALVAFAHERPKVPTPDDVAEQQTVMVLRRILQLKGAKPDAEERLQARCQLMEIFDRTGFFAEALEAANIILKDRLTLSTNHAAAGDCIRVLGLSDDAGSPDKIDLQQAGMVLRTSPDTLAAIAARTRSQLRLHNYTDSLASSNLWVAAAPDDLEPALVRVELMVSDHRSYQQALKVAEDWKKDARNANSTDFDLLDAHTALAYGQVRDNGAATRSASDSPPRTGLTQVDGLLKHAATVNPKSKLAVRILISDLDAIGEAELARQVVIRALDDNPNDKSTLDELIRRDWDSGHLNDVIELSSNLQATTAPTYIVALRATAMMMLGKRAEMAQSMQLLRDRSSDLEAAAWAKVIQQGLNGHGDDSQQILGACRAALNQNPREYYIRHFMAEAQVQLGERDTAIREWQHVIADDPNWALPAMRLAAMQLEANHPEQAFQTASIAFARSRYVAVAMVRGEAWTAAIQAGRNANAEDCLKFLSDIEKDAPKDGRPQLYKSLVLAAIGNFSQAIDVVKLALASGDPQPEHTWIQYSSLCQSSGIADPKLAQECLARSQKDNGLSSALALTRAIALHDPKRGLESFDADAAASAAGMSTSSATQPDAAVSGATAVLSTQSKLLGWELARATYLEINQNSAASAAWKALATAHPENLRVQQVALSVPGIRTDKEISAQCIQNIKKLSGDHGDPYQLARSRYLVSFEPFVDKNGQMTAAAAEARNALDDLVRANPNSIEIRLLSAQAFENLSKLPDAIRELRAASALNPSALFIRLNLASLLETTGDYEGLQEIVGNLSQKDLESFTTDTQRDNAAQLLAQQGLIDRAINLLAPQGNEAVNTGEASLLLARLYQRQGNGARAGEILKRMLANHPDPKTLAYGAEFLASSNQMDAAAKLLDELQKNPTAKPGEPERARAEFELQHDPVGGPDKAIALLQQATQKARTDAVNWRMLATIYLVTNRPQQALGAVQAGLVAVPGEPTLKAIADNADMLPYVAGKDDLRPFVYSFINDPSGAFAAQPLAAIYQAAKTKQSLFALADQLRELAKDNLRYTPLQVYLVRLYIQLHRNDEAITVATQALRATRDSSPAHQVEIEALMAAGHWSDILSSAKAWESFIPSDKPVASMATAQALVKLHRSNEALQELQPLVDLPKTRPEFSVLSRAYQDILRQYFEAASDSGVTLDLPAILKPYLALGSPGRIAWMRLGVSAYQKSPQLSDDWLRQAAQLMPPATNRDSVLEHLALAEFYEQLPAGPNTARYHQIARDTLRQLLQVPPKPEPEVLLSMGTLFDRDADYTNAINYYRQVLAVSPNNILVLNNLAMALARTGNTAEALTLLGTAVKALPDSPELLDSRAFVLGKAHQDEEAIKTMRDVVRLAPAVARFRLRLVETLCDAHHTQEAVAELKTLDTFKPDETNLSPAQLQQLKGLRTRLAGVANSNAN